MRVAEGHGRDTCIHQHKSTKVRIEPEGFRIGEEKGQRDEGQRDEGQRDEGQRYRKYLS